MATVKQISLPKKISGMQLWEMIQIPAAKIEEARSVMARRNFTAQEQLVNGSYILTRTA